MYHKHQRAWQTHCWPLLCLPLFDVDQDATLKLLSDTTFLFPSPKHRMGLAKSHTDRLLSPYFSSRLRRQQRV
jgi:hypothetical protein